MKQIFLPFLIFMATLGSCTGGSNNYKGVRDSDSLKKGDSNQLNIEKSDKLSSKQEENKGFFKNFIKNPITKILKKVKKKGFIKTVGEYSPYFIVASSFMDMTKSLGANGQQYPNPLQRNTWDGFPNLFPDICEVGDPTCNKLSLPSNGRGGTRLSDCGPYYYKTKNSKGECCLYFNWKGKEYRSCSKANCYTCFDNSLAAIVLNEEVVNKEEPVCKKKRWGNWDYKGSYCDYGCSKDEYKCAKPCFKKDFTNVVIYDLFKGKKLDTFCLGIDGYKFKASFIGQFSRPIDHWGYLNNIKDAEGVPDGYFVGNNDPNSDFSFANISLPISLGGGIDIESGEDFNGNFSSTTSDGRRRLQSTGSEDSDLYGDWYYTKYYWNMPKLIVGGTLEKDGLKSAGLFVFKPWAKKKYNMICQERFFGDGKDSTIEDGHVVNPITWRSGNQIKPSKYGKWGGYPFAIFTGQIEDPLTTYFSIYGTSDKKGYGKDECTPICTQKIYFVEYDECGKETKDCQKIKKDDEIAKILSRRVSSVGKGNRFLQVINYRTKYGDIGTTEILWDTYCKKRDHTNHLKMPIISQITSYNADIMSPPILPTDVEPLLFPKKAVYGVGEFPETSASEAKKGNVYAMQGGATLMWQIFNDKIRLINVAKYVEPASSTGPGSHKTHFDTVKIVFKPLGIYNISLDKALLAPLIGGQSETGAGTVSLANPYNNEIFGDRATLIQQNNWKHDVDVKLLLQESVSSFPNRFYEFEDRFVNFIGFPTAFANFIDGNNEIGFKPQTMLAVPLNNIILNKAFLKANKNCKEWTRYCDYVKIKPKVIECERNIKCQPFKCHPESCEGDLRETKLIEIAKCKCKYGYDYSWQTNSIDFPMSNIDPLLISDMPTDGNIELSQIEQEESSTTTSPEVTYPITTITSTSTSTTTSTPTTSSTPATTTSTSTTATSTSTTATSTSTTATSTSTTTPTPSTSTTTSTPSTSTTTSTPTISTSTTSPTSSTVSTAKPATTTITTTGIGTTPVTTTTTGIGRRLGDYIENHSIKEKIQSLTNEEVLEGLKNLNDKEVRSLLETTDTKTMNRIIDMAGRKELNNLLNRLDKDTRRQLSDHVEMKKYYENPCPRPSVDKNNGNDNGKLGLLGLIGIAGIAVLIVLIALCVCRHQRKRQRRNLTIAETLAEMTLIDGSGKMTTI